LHLYTEGFRTVEDIYNILQISHQRRKHNPELPPPKAKLMAKYYEQLTTLFWVSENHLFHAFAWYKYYALCKEFNKSMNPELKSEQASAVLLAALCIPSLPSKVESGSSAGNTTASDSRFDDSVMQEKMTRMATLLGFHTRNPTRQNLLEEITSRGIFDQVPAYLQQLYYLLEQDSDPLVLVETAKPLLEQLSKQVEGEESALGRYVEPLRSVLLLKLLWNLSSAYHTVRIDFLKELTTGLGMTFEHVEKAVVVFTQTHKGLVVRLDHRAGCLRFGDAQLESDSMRSQLTTLAQQLDKVVQTLAGEPTPDVAGRAQVYQAIRDSRLADHTKMLERKQWIEKRKEEIERLAQEKVNQGKQKAAAEKAVLKAEEEGRIQREQVLREQEKMRKIQQEIENTKKQQLLQAMGHNTEALSAEEIANLDTAALQKEHQDKINKKRDESERKIREVAKRLDYLVRAIRIEELPLIKAKYEDKVKTDREQYEQEVIEKAKRAKLQWESDKQDKERLSTHSVFDFMQEFEATAMEGRRLKHVTMCNDADQEAETQAENGKIQRARKRKQEEEKRLAEEDAQRQKEEEARIQEDDRRKKEEARRDREAQEEERRQAEEARMAEERDRKGRMQEDRGGRQSRALDSTGGGGGSKGGYVPPSRRGQAGGSRFEDRGGGNDDRGGSRFGGDRAGGYPGGGRYEGRSGGDGGRGGDRRGGGGYGDRQDDGGFGESRRDDGGSGGGSNGRWRR
jgi:translation initiation factor 3 subunit A